MNSRQLLIRLLNGRVRIVAFGDLERLALDLGFRLARSRGSHRIYLHPDVDSILNLQSVEGQAKPYQVRQLLDLIEVHGLKLGGAA